MRCVEELKRWFEFLAGSRFGGFPGLLVAWILHNGRNLTRHCHSSRWLSQESA